MLRKRVTDYTYNEQTRTTYNKLNFLYCLDLLHQRVQYVFRKGVTHNHTEYINVL